MSRPNTAVVFSGGGSRSYMASVGYMLGLHKLGLWDKVRYVTGISGGSWASTVFTFASEQVIIDDDSLLCEYALPSDITWDSLGKVAPGCVRGAPVNEDFFEHMFANFLNPSIKDDEAWTKAVHSVFMAPAGISDKDPPAHSAAHAAHIKARNPSLQDVTFATPRPGRPFLILGVDVLGPVAISPLDRFNRSYTLLEASSLYTGEAHDQEVEYHSTSGKTTSALLGGYVETFAFGGAAPDSTGNQTGGVVSTPVPRTPLSMSLAAGLSSFAPGDFVNTLPIEFLGDKFVPRAPYWAPSGAGGTTTEMYLADGGDLVNPNIIGLLLRKVSSMVIFCNYELPFSSKYDPSTPPTLKDMDEDLPSFFGYQLDPAGHRGWDISRNQVFAKQDFARVAQALKEAQKTGNGTIATVELATVKNDWWGVEAGFKVNTTWVYLDRALAWERDLNKELAALAVPHGVPDPSSRNIVGPFAHFPNYKTSNLHLTARKANLLADLCAWTMIQNKAVLLNALQ